MIPVERIVKLLRLGRFQLSGLWAILCLAIAGAASFTGLIDSAQAKPFAHEASELRPDSRILWGRLKNGLRYAILPQLDQDQVAVRLIVEAGSAMEGPREQGIAHFVEHMLFRGTKNLPQGSLAAHLERLGLTHGPDANAYTSPTSTVFKLDLPRSDPALIDESLLIMREWLDRALFVPEKIETEKGIIEAERRSGDTDQRRRSIARSSVIYGEEWAAKLQPIGRSDIVNAANQEMLRRFYERWYRPDNAIIVVTGKVDAEKLAEAISVKFRDLSAPLDNVPTPPSPTVSSGGLQTKHRLGSGEVSIDLLTVQSSGIHADTAVRRTDAMRLRAANEILKLRLTQRARSEGASYIVGGVTGWGEAWGARVGGIYLASSSANWGRAISAAEQELRRALTFGFTDEEVREARAVVRREIENRLASAADRKAGATAESLTTSIVNGQVPLGEAAELQLSDALLSKLDPNSVADALRSLWGSKDRRLLVTGDIGGQQPEVEIRKRWIEASAMTVDPPSRSKTKQIAAVGTGRVGQVIDRRQVDADISEAWLDNGVRLLIWRSASKSGRIRMALQLFGDPAQAPDAAEVMAGPLLLAGGVAAQEFDTVQQVAKAVEFNAAANLGDLRITAYPSASDLHTALELATAYVSGAAFRQPGMDLARGVANRRVTLAGQQAEALLLGRAYQAFHLGARHTGLPQSVENLQQSARDVASWLREMIAKAPATLVIAGNVDEEVVLAAAAKTLGTLSPRPRPSLKVEAPQELPVAPPGRLPRLTYAGSEQKAYVALMWPVGTSRSARSIRLEAVAEAVVLNRIRDLLRDKLGKSYAPRLISVREQDRWPGMSAVAVDCAPSEIGEIVGHAQKVAEDLVQRPISDDELARAKAPLLAYAEKQRSDDAVRVGLLLVQPDPTEATRRLASWPSDFQGFDRLAVQGELRKLYDAAEARILVVVPRGD